MELLTQPLLPYRSLDGNPLVCNCHLGWLADWLRQHGEPLSHSAGPKCHSPARLFNKPLTTIPRSAFVCSSELFYFIPVSDCALPFEIYLLPKC